MNSLSSVTDFQENKFLKEKVPPGSVSYFEIDICTFNVNYIDSLFCDNIFPNNQILMADTKRQQQTNWQTNN